MSLPWEVDLCPELGAAGSFLTRAQGNRTGRQALGADFSSQPGSIRILEAEDSYAEGQQPLPSLAEPRGHPRLENWVLCL